MPAIGTEVSADNPASIAVRWLQWLATQIERGGQVRVADETRRIAAELDVFESIRAGFHEVGTCPRCGRPLPPRTGKRGRPVVYCDLHNRARTKHAQIENPGG